MIGTYDSRGLERADSLCAPRSCGEPTRVTQKGEGVKNSGNVATEDRRMRNNDAGVAEGNLCIIFAFRRRGRLRDMHSSKNGDCVKKRFLLFFVVLKQ